MHRSSESIAALAAALAKAQMVLTNREIVDRHKPLTPPRAPSLPSRQPFCATGSWASFLVSPLRTVPPRGRNVRLAPKTP